MKVLEINHKVVLRKTIEDHKVSLELEIDGLKENSRESVRDAFRVMAEKGEWSDIEKAFHKKNLDKVKADIKRLEILMGL